VTTCWQSIVPSAVDPSSGSVTASWNPTCSPQSKTWPSSGAWRVSVGAVFPTVTGMLATVERPVGSVTVSRARKSPLAE
jgi:hypothetical protein